MIGVRQSLLCKIPSLVPTEVRFVEQNPHQLRNRHRRVRIVELDGDFLGKRAPVGVALPEAPHEIGQRAGDEKILLHKTQSLPHGSCESSGYRTRVSDSASRVSASAPTKSPLLNS